MAVADPEAGIIEETGALIPILPNDLELCTSK